MKINSWKSTLTHPGESIVNVMKIIDKDTLRVACVVDEAMNLLGLVTDGDIRRALIAGKKIDSPIKEVMNTSPKVMQSNYDHSELLKYLKANRLIHMPIVENGKLVELVTLEELLVPKIKDNPVFIMAGGFGTRLRPLTDNCPKPLLKVGDKPILETIIDSFIANGFHNFYISTHYLPEMIRDYFGDGSRKNISITYVHEESPLGTGGALGLLPKEEINLPLIMINGDILTNVNFSDLLDFHVTTKACATMAVREYDIKVPYGVVQVDNNQMTSIVEKPTHTFFVNAGIYIIDPKIVHETKVGVKIDMPSLLESECNKENKVSVFPIHEYWLDIGQLHDYEKAQKEFQIVFE